MPAQPSHAAVVGIERPRRTRRRELRTVIGPARRGELHVMTFNIRMDTGTSAGTPDHWPDREPLVTRLLELEQPSLLGLQEVMFHQLRAIADGLPLRYEMIGTGREGGSHGEYSPIFYDPALVHLEEWDQFWLSPTPEVVGSTGWEATLPRIATWGRFTEIATEREFVMLNTHVDHASAPARLHSAELIAERLRRFGLPSIVTGDFNDAAQDCPSWTTLTERARVADAWTSAANRLTPAWGSWVGYDQPVEDAVRIDWILTSSGIRVQSAAINAVTFLGRYPSDHLPVQALVRL